MKEGDVVLAIFAQTDGEFKTRPAIFLREMPPFNDLLVCGISTQLNQLVKSFDEIIALSDVDFPTSGLKSKSLIRLGFLALFPRTKIVGTIGSISPQRHERLLKALSEYLVK